MWNVNSRDNESKTLKSEACVQDFDWLHSKIVRK